MTPAPVIILLPFEAGSPEPLRKAKPRYPTKRGVERWPPHQGIPMRYVPPADLIADIRRQSRALIDMTRAQRRAS